jgi:tRNA(Ile)-lysidine synthase
MTETNSHTVTTAVRHSLSRLGTNASSKMLVGVSGGMDSMVLLHVLHHLRYNVAAAHVNFNLRGAESLNDALFVRKWSMEKGIPFHELSQDTKRYAEENNLGTQEAARNIRYDWWEELARHHAFDFVATAHHLDDTIETMFLNLLRGTGLKGLTGIPRKRDIYIRPLLDCSKGDIVSYAETFEIPYRTDESNETDHYQRNKLRHHLIPMLEEMYPGWPNNMRHTLHRINTEWDAWKNAYDTWISTSVKHTMDGFMISGNVSDLAFKLRWLEEKGIPWMLAHDFLTATDTGTGTILKHQHLSLSRTEEGHFLEETPPSLHIKLAKPGKYALGDFFIEIEQVSFEKYQPSQNPNIEFVNEEVVHWPLELRNIKAGDRFQPLGMHGNTKKLQDFLVDLKLEMYEKERQFVLTNKDHILWVIGLRLDERAKVRPEDRQVYRISYKRLSGD